MTSPIIVDHFSKNSKKGKKKNYVALREKAIDNTVKDYHTQLQACVSANGGHFEHIMW